MKKEKRKPKPPSSLVYTNRIVESARKRRLIALFCRMLGDEIHAGKKTIRAPSPLHPVENSGSVFTPDEDSKLPMDGVTIAPRQVQTLELLLTGLSEKEIAKNLKISRHTVHVYVKSLYKRFNVNSRGELLAKWVRK
jgi:DNA-binding CsgD family transcriptional regulator